MPKYRGRWIFSAYVRVFLIGIPWGWAYPYRLRIRAMAKLCLIVVMCYIGVLSQELNIWRLWLILGFLLYTVLCWK
jgi:hypothetical protein